MKRALALLLSASLTLSLAACGGGGGGTSQSGSSGTTSSDGAGELTATQQIIQEAQGMTLEELAQKGIGKKALLAGINYFEFRFREADYSSYPKGLMYGIDVMDSSPSTPAIPWSLSGSSPRTTRFLTSSPLIP